MSVLTTSESAAPTSTPVSVARIVLATLTASAIAATFFDTASRAQINPFNFFGYFTLQSNIFLAIVWVLCGASALAGKGISPFLVFARALAVTYIVIVGLVYAVLLAPLGAAGGVALPWANIVLHVVTPLAALAGWVLAPDRAPIRWRLLPLALVYPAIWISVVLVRGATDGWVPYPFLDPNRGYGSVALTCVVISAAVIMVAAVIFTISHLPIRNAALRDRLGRQSH